MIYHLQHDFISKSPEAARKASGATRYISRKQACSFDFSWGNMPDDPAKRPSWWRSQISTDRKNARVCDKFILSLPREASSIQRLEIVRSFLFSIGAGKCSGLLAIHEKGKDQENPHAHVIVRDRHKTTGKRVLKSTDKNSTNRFREAWAASLNEFAEKNGLPPVSHKRRHHTATQSARASISSVLEKARTRERETETLFFAQTREAIRAVYQRLSKIKKMKKNPHEILKNQIHQI